MYVKRKGRKNRTKLDNLFSDMYSYIPHYLLEHVSLYLTCMFVPFSHPDEVVLSQLKNFDENLIEIIFKISTISNLQPHTAL